MHPSPFHVRVWLGLALQTMCAVADVLSTKCSWGHPTAGTDIQNKKTFENIYLQSALRMAHQAIEPETY